TMLSGAAVAVTPTGWLQRSNPGASPCRLTEPARTPSNENVPSPPLRGILRTVPARPLHVTHAPLIVPPSGSVTRPSSDTFCANPRADHKLARSTTPLIRPIDAIRLSPFVEYRGRDRKALDYRPDVPRTPLKRS